MNVELDRRFAEIGAAVLAAIGLDPPPRAHWPKSGAWADCQLMALIHGMRAGRSDVQLALVIGRSVGAVRNMRRQLQPQERE